MTQRSSPFEVRMRGDLACFTRPEMKVERFSYEVITPSAARGALEAICWKPAIRWVIDSIALLAPPTFTAFKRNEVNDRISINNAKSWMKGTKEFEPYFADDSKNRAQRNTIALRDVDYAITAHFEMTPQAGPSDNVKKFEEMFRRRLERGQYYHQPYLGCREFPATVEPYTGTPAPLAQGPWADRNLGLMLYDMDFSEGPPHKPKFFHAVLRSGVIDVAAPEETKEAI